MDKAASCQAHSLVGFPGLTWKKEGELSGALGRPLVLWAAYAFPHSKSKYKIKIAAGRAWWQLAGTRMLSRHSKVTVLWSLRPVVVIQDCLQNGDQPDVAPVIPWLRRQAAGSARCDGLYLFQHFRDGGSLGTRPTKHMRTHVKKCWIWTDGSVVTLLVL